MSSDNGYIIRKHPDGGFCAVDYSMSLYMEDSYKTPDGYPMPTGREEQFPTMQAALDACDSGYILDTYYSEYGVHLDAECLNIQKDLRNELHLSVEPDDPDLDALADLWLHKSMETLSISIKQIVCVSN